MNPLLVCAKPFEAFTPDEFFTYVCSMFGRPLAKAGKKPAIALGLTLTRTKAGKLSIKRTKTQRAFAYVTNEEIEKLAKAGGFTIAETWNLFKTKEFIIAPTRMDAEKIHAELAGLPW